MLCFIFSFYLWYRKSTVRSLCSNLRIKYSNKCVVCVLSVWQQRWKKQNVLIRTLINFKYIWIHTINKYNGSCFTYNSDTHWFDNPFHFLYNFHIKKDLLSNNSFQKKFEHQFRLLYAMCTASIKWNHETIFTIHEKIIFHFLQSFRFTWTGNF